ncbi:DUF4249 domain-containing protein [uncultured Imperialibacter sp.]|uniref:DUF4249 domain-containing protein n=1 Tax=uncultured Imperialibacter sp. TaxID=1672639 RepID=UPI0030D8707A
MRFTDLMHRFKTAPEGVRKRIASKLSCAFVLLLVCVSCIEPYEVDVPKQDNILIVESMLLDHPDYQRTRLYFQHQDGPRELIYNAIVSISNKAGDSWPLVVTYDGSYVPLSGSIEVAAGDEFQLEIAIGDSIRAVSTWEKVPEPSEIDTAFMEAKYRSVINNRGIETTSKGIEIFVATKPVASQNTYLRWTYEDTYAYDAPMASDLCSECQYCYIQEEVENFIELAEVLNSKGKVLSGKSIEFVEFDERFGIRFAVLVKQLTVTKAAYEYYKSINQLNEARGSIFDPPPAVLRGNVSNNLRPTETVYGFFEVGKYSEASARITKSDIDFLIPSFYENCLVPNPGADCFDCRAREGATKVRPDYF